MAKLKVRRTFADEYTGKRYEAGESFEGTPERIEQLKQRGVLGSQPLQEPSAAVTADSKEGGK